LISSIHSLKERFDILYVLGFRASAVYWPQRLVGTKVVFNTDGFDWKRSKWGRAARRYLQISERIGVRFATGGLIADSQAVARYFARRYGQEPIYLSYGAPVLTRPSSASVERYGLLQGQYYLVVARLEPENNVLAIIDQYQASGSERPLVVVGGLNYQTEYAAAIRRRASERVRLLGAIYHQKELDALYQSCFAYIHGHEVGGTNPSLLRAMGAGALVLANGVIYNREVLGEAGYYWSSKRADLPNLMREVEAFPEARSRLRKLASERIRTLYNWDLVADGYAQTFYRIVAEGGRRRR
jgi:glycosyltransferase involved in cell wall biosynthesis